jgi:hypothetical protein
LLTITMSGISTTPAFSSWIASPAPGASANTIVSASRAISTSACPEPTVSIRTSSAPQASMSSAVSIAAGARPPRAPRLAIERMNTFRSG